MRKVTNFFSVNSFILIFVFVFVFLVSSNSFADQLNKHTFSLKTQLSHMSYKEPDVEEEGIMYGIEGSYTFRGGLGRWLENLMFSLQGTAEYGEVDYDGQLWNGTSYEINDITDYILEGRGLLGWDFFIAERVRLTPYVGYGYRYLNDDAAKDPAGYERESNYHYSPIGIELLADLKNGWFLGFEVEYDYFWKGVQESHLSDAVSSLNDVENDQEDGYGLRGSVKLVKENVNVDFIVEPYVKYWNIDRSENSNITLSGSIIGQGYEPKNNSTEAGVKLGINF